MKNINNVHPYLTSIVSMYESEVMKHPNRLEYKTKFKDDLLLLDNTILVEMDWSRDCIRTNLHTYNSIDSDIDLSVMGETIYTSTVDISKEQWRECPRGYYVSCRNEIGVGNRLMVLPCDDFFENIPEEIDYISLNNYGSVMITTTSVPKDMTLKLHLKNISEKKED